jgi:DNA (cytosine-5)-methyltransferase 1
MHKGPRGTEAVESGHVVAIQDVRGLDKKQNGKGWSAEGVSYTVDTHATQGVAMCEIDTVGTLRAHHPGTAGTQSDTDHIVAIDNAHAFKVRGGCEGGGKGYLGSDEVAFTISTHQDQHIFSEPAIGFDAYNNDVTGDVTKTIDTGQDYHHVPNVLQSTVRRLTPVECERLQGFPDNFTAIPWRKKGAEDCPDGPRYKALGNSMAVPVMRWIGERIRLIDDYISII